jgi:hypothetical protein
VVTINDRNYLDGTQIGDEVSIYNSLGQLLTSFTATSEQEDLNLKGVVIIQVKSASGVSSLKVVL